MVSFPYTVWSPGAPDSDMGADGKQKLRRKYIEDRGLLVIDITEGSDTYMKIFPTKSGGVWEVYREEG